MKYKYDKETDIRVIELRRQKPNFAEQSGNIITHYGMEGKPVEIEILDATRTAQRMMRAIQKAQA